MPFWNKQTNKHALHSTESHRCGRLRKWSCAELGPTEIWIRGANKNELFCLKRWTGLTIFKLRIVDIKLCFLKRWKALPEGSGLLRVGFRVKGQVAPGTCVGSSQAWVQAPWAERDTQGGPGRGLRVALASAVTPWRQTFNVPERTSQRWTWVVLHWPHPPLPITRVLGHLTKQVLWESTGVQLPAVLTLWSGDCLSSPLPAAGITPTQGIYRRTHHFSPLRKDFPS